MIERPFVISHRADIFQCITSQLIVIIHIDYYEWPSGRFTPKSLIFQCKLASNSVTRLKPIIIINKCNAFIVIIIIIKCKK